MNPSELVRVRVFCVVYFHLLAVSATRSGTAIRISIKFSFIVRLENSVLDGHTCETQFSLIIFLNKT